MTLIDALHVNNGGGKILLDFLIAKIDNKKKIDYLLDYRVKNNIVINKKKGSVLFLKSSIVNRYNFYNKNKKKYTKIFCFGNLPPYIRLNSEVYTYFHQPMYLSIPKSYGLIDKIKFKLKTLILKYCKANTDYWIVQSEYIKNELARKFNISKNKILTLPFYNPLPKFNSKKTKFSYLYVSNGTPHKNHKTLINAFCKFFDNYKKGTLTLTISENFTDVFNLIKEKKTKGYPINNIGFINRDKLSHIYSESEFFIFPSFRESFGLGMVEAIESSCKIIGADLPYLHEICEPSLVFDPHNEDSIYNALEKSIHKETIHSRAKVNNNIEEIVNLIS